MEEFEYPPGTLGYERRRIRAEARAIVASMPWPARLWGMRQLRRMDEADARFDRLQHEALVRAQTNEGDNDA